MLTRAKIGVLRAPSKVKDQVPAKEATSLLIRRGCMTPRVGICARMEDVQVVASALLACRDLAKYFAIKQHTRVPRSIREKHTWNQIYKRTCRCLARREHAVSNSTHAPEPLQQGEKCNPSQITYRLVPKEGLEISVSQSVGGEGGVRHCGQELRARREAALARVHGDGPVRGVLPQDTGRVDNSAVGRPPGKEGGSPAARQGIHVVISLDDPDRAVLVLLALFGITFGRGGHKDDGEEEEALDKHG